MIDADRERSCAALPAPAHLRAAVVDDIDHEAARLRWLAGRLPVPAVAHAVRTPDLDKLRFDLLLDELS